LYRICYFHPHFHPRICLTVLFLASSQNRKVVAVLLLACMAAAVTAAPARRALLSVAELEQAIEIDSEISM
jgi:hypothetical protein